MGEANPPPFLSFLPLFTEVRGIGILGSCVRFCNPSYSSLLCNVAVLSEESRPTVKEGASMRRILLVMAAAAVMAVMMVVTVAPAFAAPPSAHPTPNPNNNVSNAADTASCATDPVCTTQTGQSPHSQHEDFPKGQDKFPPATGPR